jgi:hypothetical protein
MRHISREQGVKKLPGRGPICAVCAAKLIDNFQGSEDQLIELYYANLRAVNTSLKKMKRSRRPLLQKEHAA